MVIGNWNLEWLNHNAQRSYPFTTRATKTDTTGTLTLPDSFLVGLYLPIHSGLTFAPSNFFVRRVLISPTGFNITVGYEAAGDTVDVAAANIIRTGYVADQTYALGGINDFADCVGQLVLGSLDDIDKLPPGLYEFTQAAGELETDCIRPMIRGVQRLQISNNNELSAPIYGDVTLVAGGNINIDVATVGSTTEITIKAISGANLNETCACVTNSTGPCIRSINGVTSLDGNFMFAPDSCLAITPLNGANNSGLKFADTCATPCCGCKELDALKNQVNRFGDGAATLQNFLTRMGGEVTQMSLVVLGSKLGDSGCTSG